MTIAYLSFMFRALVYTCLTSYETKSIIVALLLQIINGEKKKRPYVCIYQQMI